MKTVRDIMSPVVLCLHQDTPIRESLETLFKFGISGAPVVDGEGEYLGILTVTDIASRFAELKPNEEAPKETNADGEGPDVMTAKELMTPHLFKISASASLEELGRSLLIANVHRLLVMDEGETVGLVSTTDLIHGFVNPEAEHRTEPRRPRSRPYIFETELVFDGSKVKVATGPGTQLELEAPVEFGGSGQHASAEDLFVASISTCLCLTFMNLAKRNEIEVTSYQCRAIGRLEGDGVGLRFTRVDLYPQISANTDPEKLERILGQAKLRCLVGRSIGSLVAIHPKFDVAAAPAP